VGDAIALESDDADGARLRASDRAGQSEQLLPVPARDGDADAGERGRRAVHLGDAGACQYRSLYAGQYDIHTAARLVRGAVRVESEDEPAATVADILEDEAAGEAVYSAKHDLLSQKNLYSPRATLVSGGFFFSRARGIALPVLPGRR